MSIIGGTVNTSGNYKLFIIYLSYLSILPKKRVGSFFEYTHSFYLSEFFYILLIKSIIQYINEPWLTKVAKAPAKINGANGWVARIPISSTP